MLTKETIIADILEMDLCSRILFLSLSPSECTALAARPASNETIEEAAWCMVLTLMNSLTR
jgi:hypothetical protein